MNGRNGRQASQNQAGWDSRLALQHDDSVAIQLWTARTADVVRTIIAAGLVTDVAEGPLGRQLDQLGVNQIQFLFDTDLFWRWRLIATRRRTSLCNGLLSGPCVLGGFGS